MREWYNSRSFLELQKALAALKNIEINDEAQTAISDLLKRTMESDKNRELGFDCAALMIEKSGSTQWLADAFIASGKVAFFWCEIAATDAQEVIEHKKQALNDLFCNMPGKRLPGAMSLSLAVKGQQWFDTLVLELPYSLWKTAVKTLTDASLTDEGLLALVEDVFSKRQASADQLMWLWKRKGGMEIKDKYITHTNLFIIVSRAVSKHFIKARKQLIELISDDDKFLEFLVSKGDDKKVKSFMEHLRTYGNRAGVDEKKMLLRIAHLYPKALKNIEKATSKKVDKNSIDFDVTSPRAYAEYQKKLKEVIEEIPQNKEQIQRAREFGDFSENSELDAAKERRDYLLARQTELTEALDRIHSVNFAEMNFEGEAILGSTVTIEVDGDGDITYHLLGCWDSNPEKNILSSGAELTKLLFGKKPGARIVLPNGKKAKVTSVVSLDAEVAKYINTVE